MSDKQGLFFFFFWLCYAASGMLVPQPGIEPHPWQGKHAVLTLDCQGMPRLWVFNKCLKIY